MSCHYVLQTMTRVFFINTNTLAPLIYFWFLQANDNTIRMQIEVVFMHNYVRTKYVLKFPTISEKMNDTLSTFSILFACHFILV